MRISSSMWFIHLRNVTLVVGLGILIALGVAIGLSILRPVVLMIALAGLVLLIPPFILKSARSYWLFVYILSLPLDIHKRLTTWIAEPAELFTKYGMPPSGTLSLDLYVSDLALIALISTWLYSWSRKKEEVHFPKIAYIFVLYLTWALVCTFINGQSLPLALFEWVRQLIYFLSFIYLVNTLRNRTDFRVVAIALVAGMAFETAAVIWKFQAEIGSDVYAFAGVYSETSNVTDTQVGTLYAAESGEGTTVKRSSGTFSHPALAAYYLEFILPLTLVMLLTVASTKLRLLLAGLYLLAAAALVLTFSRTGLVSYGFGVVVTLALVRWRDMMPRKAFAVFALLVATTTALAFPFIIDLLSSRPEALALRFTLLERGMGVVLDNPVLGAGLNHATAALPESLTRQARGTVVVVSVVHNHYLNVLIEVGVIGALLKFGFFWRVINTTVRCTKYGDYETVVLSMGILGAIATIALHNMGDPFGGHTNHAMLWLFAGVAVALQRRLLAEQKAQYALSAQGLGRRPAHV